MNKNSLVVIGGGGHALSIISMVNEDEENKIIGYTDLENKGIILGANYLGNEHILNPNNYPHLLMGISYTKSPVDRELRNNLTNSLLNKGFKFPSIISKDSILSHDIRIKQGTIVFKGVIINTSTEIGEHAIINTGSVIEHGCKIGNQFFLGPKAVICGDVSIGDNVFIGAGAIIKDSVKICDNVVIGMGAIVLKNINAPGVYFGNPIKKI
jgi:sugar O-acyltransferase (sialic acid O-acetyltransferase NeuD family)